MLAAFATVTVGLGDARVGAESCGAVGSQGSWTVITAPSFADNSGDHSMHSWSVDPSDPKHLLATNGTTVVRSDDGGCLWRRTYSAPTVPTGSSLVALGQTQETFHLEQVVAAAGSRAYVVVHNASERRGTVQLATSTDGGSNWTLQPQALEGSSIGIAASAPAPDTVYLALQTGSGPVLYVTTNGGANWTAGAALPGVVRHVQADDSDANTVWVVANEALFVSEDGAAHIRVARDNVHVADVAHPQGGPTVITAFGGDGSVVRSTDGGDSFTDMDDLAAGAESLVHATDAPERTLAVTNFNAFVSTGSEWVSQTDPSITAYKNAQATQTAPTVAYVEVPEGLARIVLDATSATPPLHFPPTKLAGPGAPRIVPPLGDVVVPAGTQVSVREVIELPRRLANVDVFFAIDTTSSMDRFVSALRAGLGTIVEGLRSSSTDSRIGVSDFRDYPVTPYGCSATSVPPGRCQNDFPYRRLLDIAPPTAELRRVLANLDVGGGGDDPEAQLTGLYQAATGAGQGAPGTPVYIRPGQGATFRSDVEHVIIVATDEIAHRSESDASYPGPSFDATVRALRAKNIKVVGIAVEPKARGDLVAVASATGAVAGTDVDCDADGTRDIAAGAALVCPLATDGTNLAITVLSSLRAADARGPVDVEVTGAGGVVHGWTPHGFGVRNLGLDNALPFQISLGCTKDQAGQRLPVSISARVDGAEKVHTAGAVVCQAGLATPAPAAPQVRTPPPPGQPPAPAPALHAQVNPATQPAMAHEEQEQAQFTLATDHDDGPGGQPVLAFSAGLLAFAGAAQVRSRRLRARGATLPALARTGSRR